jgi:hypothetical protein
LIRSRAGRGASAPVDSSKAPGWGQDPFGAARVTVVEQRNVADTEASTDAPIIYVCITCRRAGEPESEPRPGQASTSRWTAANDPDALGRE